MSIFVDDLTFSGKNVNNLLKTNIKKIINSAGLCVHPDKTQLYRHNEPKLITGVIVNGNNISVKNSHRQKIYTSFKEIKAGGSVKESGKLKVQLLGRLNAAGQIDYKFKQRAKNLSSPRSCAL